eukprot:2061524-Amphidinium_carterae.1
MQPYCFARSDALVFTESTTCPILARSRMTERFSVLFLDSRADSRFGSWRAGDVSRWWHGLLGFVPSMDLAAPLSDILKRLEAVADRLEKTGAAPAGAAGAGAAERFQMRRKRDSHRRKIAFK